jgi:site-specific DNA-methyltransferase (adenine-specific)
LRRLEAIGGKAGLAALKTTTMGKFILGDCMDLETGLPSYPDNFFDLAIVDPPYGAADAIAPKSSRDVYAAKRTEYKLFKNVKPESDYFAELFRVSKKWIVWGGNFFAISGGVIVWNKEGTAFGEGEVAICNTHASVKFAKYTWNGMIQQEMKSKELRIHPTQKPVALYRWLLENYAKPGQLILDTHVGSASSLIACESMGFDYVGFEIDPDYYAAAKNRMSKGIQAVLIS